VGRRQGNFPRSESSALIQDFPRSGNRATKGDRGDGEDGGIGGNMGGMVERKGLHRHAGVKNGLHGHAGARMACMVTQDGPTWPHSINCVSLGYSNIGIYQCDLPAS